MSLSTPATEIAPTEPARAASQPPPAGSGWFSSLLSTEVRLLSLAAVVASFFLPPAGFGVDLCPVHRATGLPCPGCGITRAITLVSQGDPLSALGANPFVVLVWPLLFGLALTALFPPRAIRALEERLLRHDRVLSRVYRVVLYAFLGFGAARFLVFLALWEPFPG